MAEFQTVAKVADVDAGEMKLVDVDGEEGDIANVSGEYFAVSNTCTHEGGTLADGELEGDSRAEEHTSELQ